MKSLLRRPETITLLILLIAFAISGTFVHAFLSPSYLFEASSLQMETWIMALTMTFVIISGNIDLSVASGLALICVASARLYTDLHVPMPVVMLLAILMGIILGLFNGLIITYLRLPSLSVTLGTLALYRGLAQRMAGDGSISGFPDWFTGVDYREVGIVPAPMIIFLVLAVIFGIILHKTVFGRCVYAIGTNEDAARFSGLQVDRVKLSIFVLSGLTMSIGALMMMSRLGNARYDHASGAELSVITAVVLGGTDIFGGRGSIIGTVIALVLLLIVQQGMALQNITPDNQLAVTGSLLVVSVILANLTNKLGSRTRRKPPAAKTSGGEPVHA